MKKITLSVAALAIAMSSFGQCEKYKIIHGESNEVITLTKTEWDKFQNEICGFTKFIDNSFAVCAWCSRNLYEVINTAEDMIEWIGYDVENGKTDSSTAETYIDNLEQIINDTQKAIDYERL